ncbi:MAG: hypothetical protein HYT66_00980 [Candidatus Yanofskybacteria bacterium]|nr:hypothetical protein [Candidatus Yanofskybacteria bacterium]
MKKIVIAKQTKPKRLKRRSSSKICRHLRIRYTMPNGDALGYDRDLVECRNCGEEGRDYEYKFRFAKS